MVISDTQQDQDTRETGDSVIPIDVANVGTGVVSSVTPRIYTEPSQARPPVTDEELARTREDLSMGDQSLLTRVIGQQPTSLRSNTIQDACDTLILHKIRETDQEAKQLKAQATQAIQLTPEYGDYSEKKLKG